MSITLDIPQELEHKLLKKARSRGVTLSEYVVQILTSETVTSNVAIKTGTDLVAYWQNHNLIGTRPDISDSQNHARDIRARAEKRL